MGHSRGHAEALKAQRPRRRQDQKLSKELSACLPRSLSVAPSRLDLPALRESGSRLMSQLRLQVLQKRRFRPLTTQSRHPEPLAPNRLKQLAQPPNAPNQVWCADLTYLPSQQEGWLYLAAELDLCSKRVVGWKLASSLATPLVKDASSAQIGYGNPTDRSRPIENDDDLRPQKNRPSLLCIRSRSQLLYNRVDFRNAR